jgi:hypothetical protein
MERRTAMQSAAIFVVTVAAGLPFALQAGQWLADWPTSAPPQVPAPVSTGLAAPDATEPPAPVEQPGGDPQPWYGPQGDRRPAATAKPAAKLPAVGATEIPEGSSAPTQPVDTQTPAPTDPSTGEPTPDEPTEDPQEHPSEPSLPELPDELAP